MQHIWFLYEVQRRGELTLAVNFSFWINKLMSRIYLSNPFSLKFLNEGQYLSYNAAVNGHKINQNTGPLKPWTHRQENILSHIQLTVSRTIFKMSEVSLAVNFTFWMDKRMSRVYFSKSMNSSEPHFEPLLTRT